MKKLKSICFMALAVSLLGLSGVANGAPSGNDVTVRVDFSNPSGFRDINFDGMNTDKGRQIVLNQIRDVFRSEAQKHLPSGYTLDLRVQDIDLAGEYEPGRLPENDVRIDKAIYPPRIKFEYQILDEAESLVGEGRESLTDLNYLMNPARALKRNGDVTFDVAALIRDWMKGPLTLKMREAST